MDIKKFMWEFTGQNYRKKDTEGEQRGEVVSTQVESTRPVVRVVGRGIGGKH